MITAMPRIAIATPDFDGPVGTCRRTLGLPVNALVLQARDPQALLARWRAAGFDARVAAHAADDAAGADVIEIPRAALSGAPIRIGPAAG